MPKSNKHRSVPSSSSSRLSSAARPSRRTQTTNQTENSRSLSVSTMAPSSSSPSSTQEYVIIITNNSELVRQPSAFRFRIPQPTQSTSAGIHPVTNSNHMDHQHQHSHDYNDRELILNNLLRIELADAIQQYISRTRQSSPIYYIFDTSNQSQ